MEFSGSIVMTLVFVSLLFAVSSGILASKKNRNFIGCSKSSYQLFIEHKKSKY